MVTKQKLLSAVRGTGLSARDWSDGDDVCLAVYDAGGESYLGTVCLVAGAVCVGKPWDRRDEPKLARVICAAVTP